MVKRQTVWLSTMMVLSLMLIGYYTMNNGAPGSSQNGAGGSVTTGVAVPSSSQGGNAATTTMGSDIQSSSVADTFINQQTTVNQQLAQRQGLDMKIIENNSSSSDQIQNAEQDMKQVNQLKAGIDNAESAVQAQGYSECAIVPTSNGGATVYVPGSSLTSLKAAQILDTVSQNTGISPELIHVQTEK